MGRGRKLTYTTGLLMKWGYADGLNGTPWACLGTMMGIWQRQQITRCQSFAGRRPRWRRARRSAVCSCYKSHNWWQRPTSRRIQHHTGTRTVTVIQQIRAQRAPRSVNVLQDYSTSRNIYRVNVNHIPCVFLRNISQGIILRKMEHLYQTKGCIGHILVRSLPEHLLWELQGVLIRRTQGIVTRGVMVFTEMLPQKERLQ